MRWSASTNTGVTSTLANAVTLGAVANWNKCLGVARGEFVMVLHEDDAPYPRYLETVLPLLGEGT